MDEELNTLDDVQEGAVDPQLPDDASAAEGAAVPEEGAATPQQTPEENAAFAAMRRRQEELERELTERNTLLESLFQDSEDPLLEARAYASGKSPEDMQAELQLKQELSRRDAEIAELRHFKAQSTFNQDLHAIKTAYPELAANSIDDLGPQFLQIMATGQLDAVTAYEIIRAREERTKITPPPEVGKVNQNSTANKEYFTPDEVKAMSQEEVHKNWEKIEKSRTKWK